jgi:vacuolar-type H+-ATPase subunit C/Vma6
MGAVHAYSVTQATARALTSDLLSADQWETLIGAVDYDAALLALSRTIYGPYLQIDRSLLTPRRVVYQIRIHLADIYAKLIRIAPEGARTVLRELWHHYEVDNIKGALRGVEVGAPWDQVLHLLYPMPRYVDVGVETLERMVRTRDVAKAIGVLDGTRYHGILEHAMTRYEFERSLFPLEVALDLGYRRNLWSTLMRLSSHDREMALKTVGTALDSDNLLWAIRFRIYHGLSEAEIINYTLATGYEVKDDDIHDIAHGEDIGRVVFRVYPQMRERLRGVAFASGEGLAKLEYELLALLISRCRRMFLGSPFHIGIPLALVWLKEYEIRDITVVLEAKASGARGEVFRPMLLLQPRGPDGSLGRGAS